MVTTKTSVQYFFRFAFLFAVFNLVSNGSFLFHELIAFYLHVLFSRTHVHVYIWLNTRKSFYTRPYFNCAHFRLHIQVSVHFVVIPVMIYSPFLNRNVSIDINTLIRKWINYCSFGLETVYYFQLSRTFWNTSDWYKSNAKTKDTESN